MVDRVPNFQFVDPRTGMLTPAAIGYLQGFVNRSGGIANVLSGVALARQEAATAKAAADAANVTAQDVADAALSMSVALSVPSLEAGIIGPGTALTGTVTATVSGGTGPYTYAWTKVSGTTLTLSAPASATTSFERVLGNGELVSAIYRVTATDSLSATASAAIGVTLGSTDPFEGGGLPP